MAGFMKSSRASNAPLIGVPVTVPENAAELGTGPRPPGQPTVPDAVSESRNPPFGARGIQPRLDDESTLHQTDGVNNLTSPRRAGLVPRRSRDHQQVRQLE